MGQVQTDVVYVLGNGSAWGNNEIRFSLRSIQENLLGFRRVYIVGYLPDFLKNVIHIPANDVFNPLQNADGNIIVKVLEACKQKGLSKNFLFINDDHLVLKPIHIAGILPFHKGDMAAFPDSYWGVNFWRGRLKRTMEVLVEKGLPARHFDGHLPILVNKKKFPGIIKQFNYREGIGYTMKSLYGNVVYRDAPILREEKKTIFNHLSLGQIRGKLVDATFMSFNDQGLNKALKYWLYENFPEMSEFEIYPPADRVLDLTKWDLNGRGYKEGVEVFTRYFKNRNLLALFLQKESPALKKKLEYKLIQQLNNI